LAHTALFSGDQQRIFFLRGPKPLDDSTLGSVELFSVGVDGTGEKRHAELSPIRMIGKHVWITRDDVAFWSQDRRDRAELWVAELPGGDQFSK